MLNSDHHEAFYSGYDEITSISGCHFLYTDRGSYRVTSGLVDKSTGDSDFVITNQLFSDSMDSPIMAPAPVFHLANQTDILRNFLYDCLHSLPMPIDGEVYPITFSLGAIVNNISSNVSFWNAYLHPISISSAVISQSGITYSGDDIVSALGITIGTITVDRHGQATVDATIQIETSARSIIFYVTGYRAYVLPLWAQAPLIEVLSPKTWIFTSENGKEQRMDMRDIPRRKFKFNTFATSLDWLKIVNLFRSRLSQSVAVPMYHEASFLNCEYYTGDTVISVDTNDSEYYVGGYAGIWVSVGQVHFAKITNITSSTITLDQPLPFDVLGEARILPVVACGYSSGSVKEDIMARSGGDKISYHNITWELETSEGDDLRGFQYPNLVGDYDVFPYVSEDLGGDVHFVEQWEVDFDFGVRLTGTNSLASRASRNYKITLFGKSEVWDFRRFIHSHTNRVPFWVSTNKFDVYSVNPISASTTVIEILDLPIIGFYEARQYRMALCLKYPDGSVDYREILSFGANNGYTTIINIDATSNSVEHSNAETRISFLLLCRIDGEITMRHFGYKTEAQFRVIEVFQ